MIQNFITGLREVAPSASGPQGNQTAPSGPGESLIGRGQVGIGFPAGGGQVGVRLASGGGKIGVGISSGVVQPSVHVDHDVANANFAAATFCPAALANDRNEAVVGNTTGGPDGIGQGKFVVAPVVNSAKVEMNCASVEISLCEPSSIA
jgi:hypothetical protein